MLRAYVFFVLAAAFVASFLSGGSDPKGQTDSNTEQRVIDVPAESDGSQAVPLQSASMDGVEIRRRADGHFYADVTINGIPVNILVDTGATGIALTRDDARKVGLAISPRMDGVVGRGASGDVRGEYVQLDRVTLGSRSAEAVPAIVLDSGSQSLLGQSFLQQFDSVEIQGNRMLLR